MAYTVRKADDGTFAVFDDDNFCCEKDLPTEEAANARIQTWQSVDNLAWQMILDHIN